MSANVADMLNLKFCKLMPKGSSDNKTERFVHSSFSRVEATGFQQIVGPHGAVGGKCKYLPEVQQAV